MDDVTQLLLSSLAGQSETVPTSLADLVQQSLGDDPLAAPLAAMIRQRAEADDEDDEANGMTDADAAELLESLYAEVEALRERVKLLADALGACPRCFGEDELCPVCHGRGRPGGRQPDPTLYAELVDPARLRLRGLDPDELLVPTPQST